ncbi:MAG: hypothetical protein WDN03_16430 [Rhizomicrobium sp.]
MSRTRIRTPPPKINAQSGGVIGEEGQAAAFDLQFRRDDGAAAAEPQMIGNEAGAVRRDERQILAIEQRLVDRR